MTDLDLHERTYKWKVQTKTKRTFGTHAGKEAGVTAKIPQNVYTMQGDYIIQLMTFSYVAVA